jgi:F0F1-type ATP synthase delta subunit
MQNTLISALLLDLIVVLKADQNFFELAHKDREEVLEKLSFSASVKHYLVNIKANSLIGDLEELAKNMLASPYKNNRQMGVKLVELLSTYFDYQMEVDVEKILGDEENAHYLLVQSPVKLESSFKDEIRESLTKEYPNASPIFVVNKGLIGGLRIYIDGKTEDLSWISKINILTSLNK